MRADSVAGANMKTLYRLIASFFAWLRVEQREDLDGGNDEWLKVELRK